MQTTTKTYRYQLPKKAIKADCPDCSPKHRKTLSRYVDTKTDEPLPEQYGRCYRESNCGYHLSPYHKDSLGMSYADKANERNQMPPIPRTWFRHAGKQKRRHILRESIVHGLITMQGATQDQAEYVARYIFDNPLSRRPKKPDQTIYSIPEETFQQSLGHYEQNILAQLLLQQFGERKATMLLNQFNIGTSNRWNGACVFWYIDELGRKRGGQIKLFGNDWHTAKEERAGEKKPCISWVHSSLKYKLTKAGKPLSDWLTNYCEKAEPSPCLFGLPQLSQAPPDKPIAIVEAPKTAVIGSAMIPNFIWLAIGAKSYLNEERLSPVRNRKVVLYPDLNAYDDWCKRVEPLQAKGYRIEVSDYLEKSANDQQKQQGLDLADFLLLYPPTVTTMAEQLAHPGTILKPDESQLERLIVEPCKQYPPEWDEPTAPNSKPTIRQQTFFEWQRNSPPFNKMGIQSL